MTSKCAGRPTSWPTAPRFFAAGGHGETDAQRLHLTWTETGDPEVSAPHKGAPASLWAAFRWISKTTGMICTLDALLTHPVAEGGVL
jgi:hypothetical protein